MTHDNTQDPRHLKRVKIVQELFAYTFNNKQELSKEAKKIWSKRKNLDPFIEKTAPEWPIDKLNKIDLSILRLAVFELTISKDAPVKVIVDEAVELAKELGSETSSSFVNGVLGTIIDDKGLENKVSTKDNSREEVFNIIAQSLGIEISDINEEKDLRKDLGFQDLEITQVLEIIQKKYKFDFEEQDLEKINNVGDILDLIL